MRRKREQKIDSWYNIKIYLTFLRKYRWTVLGMVLFSLFLEAVSVTDKYLFKKIIDEGTSYVAGTLSLENYAQIIMVVAVVFLSLAFFQIIAKWIHQHLILWLDADVMFDLKQHFFGHLIYLSHNFHTTHKTGALIARLNRGATAMERMTDFIAYNTLPLLFQVLLVGASLIYFSAKTGLVVVITAVAFVTYSFIIIKMQRKANVEANFREDIEKGYISDVFTNIESIKHFGKEEYIRGKFQNLSMKARDALKRYWGYYRWFDAGHLFIITIGTFFLIYYPLQEFMAGSLSLGTLVFVYTVYGSLFGPLLGFVHGVRGFYRSMADFQDLFDYGKLENEIKETPGAPNLTIKEGDVEFKHVQFNYGKRRIFTDFSLKVPRNKRVALVGHSGSGKSTLVKLVYRLYDPQQGEIFIDGKNIKEFKQESVRSELSIVPQECVLFDDTVYNNVAFSKPNASRAEIMRAMKFAQLDKVVAKFPNKENTVVGERGVRLSGGEKQRVSIARALLADKKVLVLDEATSSLDSQTEHEIQHGLRELMKGRTSIIIAHRLSTIMSADVIVVLDKGRIVQQGTHKELISKPGMYRKLWNLQKGGYIVDDNNEED